VNRRPSTDEATADTEASSERRVGAGAVVTKSLSRFPHSCAEGARPSVSLMEAAGIVRVTVYSEFDSVQAARDAVHILGGSGYHTEYTRKDESKTYAVVARASTGT
jgi:hypothetical protein